MPSTISTGGWSASSPRTPTTRSVLPPSGIVSPGRQLGTAHGGGALTHPRRERFEMLLGTCDTRGDKRQQGADPVRRASAGREEVPKRDPPREGLALAAR